MRKLAFLIFIKTQLFIPTQILLPLQYEQ